MRNYTRQFHILILLLAAAAGAWGQARDSGKAQIDISGVVDWEQGEINAAASLNLASAGIRLPAGRIRGEEILGDEYPRLLRPLVFSVQADSASTVEDYLRRDELTLSALDDLILKARNIAPSLSADLALITGRYVLSLKDISLALIRHRRAGEAKRPLIPSPAADYSGIIIIADKELPIHGRNSSALIRPCLFPKIWDTDMQEIYARNLADPARPMVRYSSAENIFRPTPSGLEGDLAELAGPHPLRILARGVFGACPTDPIIDKEDALKIISTENNRRLLQEGRVVFILNRDQLKNSL
jgi:hypothetical protein